jgi:hypothetical protein
MSKKRNTYKEFFGIREQNDNNGMVRVPKDTNPDKIKDLTDKGMNVELEEAELINNITDYQGGVQYMLRDPAMADNVAEEIKQFAIKKKIYPVKHRKSKSRRAGYFYFRLGDDPAKESQQLQGYFSQKPEIRYFRFKVMQDPQPQPNRNV